MSNLRAHFYDKNGKTYVSIGIVGGDTWCGKAGPEHEKQFPLEYAAYIKGKDEPEPEGTSLLEIPGMTEERARVLKFNKIRTVEEVAALSDAAVGVLGLGGNTFREAAKLVLKAKAAEPTQEKRGPGRPKREDK